MTSGQSDFRTTHNRQSFEIKLCFISRSNARLLNRRRQLAKVQGKKVVAIPEQDYRYLMNTNLSTFQSMDYDTVHYTLVGPEKWIHLEFCADENKEAVVLRELNSVNMRSRSRKDELKKDRTTINPQK
jgi:hypothetical protein